MPKKNKQKKAWVVAVDMGYGHQRAAYPFGDIAEGKILNANNYAAISRRDRNVWKRSRRFYEAISRAKHLPMIGEFLFGLYDNLQKIKPFYPKRDLSKSSLQLNQMFKMIKGGWGREFVELLNSEKLPFLTTFFVPAFFADYHKYPGDIYCIICDADMSRTWVSKNPKKSKIKYFASNKRVEERLKLYGVPAKNIYLTGFPLPKENIGGLKMPILRKDLSNRIWNLDPRKVYMKKYNHTLKHYLNHRFFPSKSNHKLTITFAVGGAGAQREIGAEIIKSLRKKILKNEINVNLVAGVRNKVYVYFKDVIEECGLKKCLCKSVNIIFDVEKEKYFAKFNKALRTTDILWTKPSELTFYSGLGLPIIMAPPIGSQEFFNREWLRSIGAGIDQEDPKYTNEWLFDWIESGWLAEAAMEGFLDAPKFGTYNIEKIIFSKKKKVEEPLLLY